MICSNGTFCSRSRCARSTVWLNATLRSSSPWISSTGDFQVAMDELGDDWNASLRASASSGGEPAMLRVNRVMNADQSCTPCRSTPAAKMSELRASAMAVRYPPYEPPHEPMRFGSTFGSDCKYLPAATMSLYSDAPRQPPSFTSRNLRPYMMPVR